MCLTERLAIGLLSRVFDHLVANFLAMSYILEALKKSSEERARVVSVSPPTEPALASARRSTRMHPGWLIAGVGLCVLTLTAVTWTRTDLAKVEPGRSPGHSPTAAEPARLTDPAAAPPHRETPPVAASHELAPAKDDAGIPAKAIAEDAPPTPKKQLAKPPLPPPDRAAFPVANTPAAEPVPHSRSEMPPALLQQVLAIPISAHVYSGKPVERMIIVDGRAVREGDSLPSGVLVEQITPTGILVSFQGYRANRPVN